MFILYETNHNNNDHIFFTQQKYQYNGVYHNMSAMRFLKWREIELKWKNLIFNDVKRVNEVKKYCVMKF
jgi:hypothetical protein